MATTTAPAGRKLGLSGWNLAYQALSIGTIVMMLVFMWAALSYARPAANLTGNEAFAYRILPLHLGAIFGATAAFLTSLVGCVVYLITRNLDWDRVTQASIEVGIVMSISLTVAGAIWGRPAWNTYWTWDPRLTTTTITILVYLAYLLFRNGIDNRRTQALFGNIYALIAFLSIPLTYYSARWFRSIHPILWDGNNAEAQGNLGGGVGNTMGTTIGLAAISFSLLFSTLMIMRWRQLRLEDHIEELREELE